MSKTRLGPNSSAFICHILAEKKFPLHQNLTLFPELLYRSGLIFWLLHVRMNLLKSYIPLLRILARNSFSCVDLIEKRIQLIFPPSYFISLCFHRKPWPTFSFTRLVVQNLSNHLLLLPIKWDFALKQCEIKISYLFSWKNMKDMSIRFSVKVHITGLNKKFWNLKIV
jgi:hypothetical protein